ncbi:sensor histidine kinase [Nonomuraea typhae]|uniref:histidine kinase n=1 Tax=Nonomuraea typhae TaxID=2603600 RepID=A0ABW7Z2Z1_9ACTN
MHVIPAVVAVMAVVTALSGRAFSADRLRAREGRGHAPARVAARRTLGAAWPAPETAAMVAGCVSIAVTAASVAWSAASQSTTHLGGLPGSPESGSGSGPPGGVRGAGESLVSGTGWVFVEVPALLALTHVAARRRPMAAVVPGLAVATVLLRQVWNAPWPVALGGCATWALPAVAAAGAGLYLRWLDRNRVHAVAAAVQDQRLGLARDLHDFVAHDVSGMLVQAQAARLVPGLPEHVADALRRIEEGGHRALASLDRTVHMLNDPGRAPTPGLERVGDLAEGFSPAVAVSFDVETAGVSREASATAYRVVSEALTNVRRHAPRASAVSVRVAADGERVTVRVEDDGATGRTDGQRATPGRKGGFGLAGLGELLAATGGSLEAGPYREGWRLTAVIPV